MRRPLAVLSVSFLALLAVAVSLPAEPVVADGADGGPMLEVVIDEVASAGAIAAASKAVSDHASGLPGFVRTDAAVVKGAPQRLLRATVWDSVRSTEAASLACDGHAAQKALDGATVPARRQRRFFRRLRSVEYAKAPTGHLEVTLYRTRVGTTRTQNLQRFDAAEPDFAKGPGIVGHSMWIAPDGLWAHVVHWESEAAFAKTGKALMRTKGVGGWIRSLDFKRFKVWKGDALGR